ncbi:MAG: methylamine methyltransferase corrinoid protein reductive activase [Candidatus Methanomethylophilaceae archaeon]|nr:methylamine methyltransferase corrinoid protein reductive activase [Candidatus Methanomethylophilaceae archaeon]MBQ8180134.1 methylamine methyltransferase corrinoid protein reductive activase [Candidatus Methanomethylophilaceae archaeon]MBR2348433.1 methylamine methyltransferase corrinoid protein reductive activase [Candidatus Methanomethylophilaceae archaeon]
MSYGISLDIGTSGTRGHAVDLSNGKILSTAVTECHPLPGANIMDHLTFCINFGTDIAHKILMDTVNKLIAQLGVDLNQVEKVSICGNPIQLSLFQGIPVDDLAFAGENAHKARGIQEQKRDAGVFSAVDVGLNVKDGCELYVPPSIRHEIGADALAMMYKSGFLEEKENCMVTDYGTNAEMALKIGDDIYTGSAAAGPAMEGQSIQCGMLAGPGAISDLEYDFKWICKVLDDDIIPQDGDKVDFGLDIIEEYGPMRGKAKGITGTGVIAAVSAAMDDHLWRKGKLQTSDGKLHLQDGVFIDSKDISEALKAIGAMRAGHFTLLEHAGIKFEELGIMYMAGASGTYVDAVKARDVGLLPPSCHTIYQYGNTSLAMATDILKNPELLDELQGIANGIRANHIMFAGDKIFEQIYMQELAVCDEGMSMEMYNRNNAMVGIQELPKPRGRPKVHRMVQRDIPDLGERGLTILHDIGTVLKGKMDGCTGCGKCQKECPEQALTVGADKEISVLTKNCLGTACFRCQFVCPEKVYKYDNLKLTI